MFGSRVGTDELTLAALATIVFVYGLCHPLPLYLPFAVFSMGFGGVRHCATIVCVFELVGLSCASLFQIAVGYLLNNDNYAGWFAAQAVVALIGCIFMWLYFYLDWRRSPLASTLTSAPSLPYALNIPGSQLPVDRGALSPGSPVVVRRDRAASPLRRDGTASPSGMIGSASPRMLRSEGASIAAAQGWGEQCGTGASGGSSSQSRSPRGSRVTLTLPSVDEGEAESTPVLRPRIESPPSHGSSPQAARATRQPTPPRHSRLPPSPSTSSGFPPVSNSSSPPYGFTPVNKMPERTSLD